MNPIIEYLTGMNALTDQIVAMDLLNSAKSGVRNYAMAATEAGTPEVKAILTRHLEEALDMHEQISRYMMEKAGITRGTQMNKSGSICKILIRRSACPSYKSFCC